MQPVAATTRAKPQRKSNKAEVITLSDDDAASCSSSGSDAEEAKRPTRGKGRAAAAPATASKPGKRGGAQANASPVKASKSLHSTAAGKAGADGKGVKWYDSYEFNGDDFW